ncbi:outer membrane beta-barrel protein [bacterium]|nr:outer membrane beta-barrel protein [candidate division CSSED10-310 bacterium]
MRMVFLFVMLAALSGSVCLAADLPVTISAGVIHWFSSWDTDLFDGKGIGSFGPKLSIGYHRFGLGVIFLKGSFDLDLKGGGTADGTRTDIDIVLQYSVNEYFSAGVGYKALDYDLNSHTQTAEEKMAGFGLGISGFYPLGTTSLYAYGSLSYLPLIDVEYETEIGDDRTSRSVDGSALNLEAGLGYTFRKLPIGIDLGYRYQNVDKGDIERNTSDTFQGPVIDASLLL